MPLEGDGGGLPAPAETPTGRMGSTADDEESASCFDATGWRPSSP